jgi:hypothetical protein
MSYLHYLCLFGSFVPPALFRRAHVSKLEVQTNQTNTNNVNKT